jgi:hypothetical protein
MLILFIQTSLLNMGNIIDKISADKTELVTGLAALGSIAFVVN